jgi:Raf kinase inhibitor-like YbhB/YbcL family protein
MRLESPAFPDGAPIPVPHSRDGGDASPPLSWSDPPAGTRSFALICDDPDAPRGTWVHWVLWGILASARSLPAGAGSSETPAGGGTHGTNDFRERRWGGPAPPKGHGVHHYRFHLYALDAEPKLKAGASRAELDAAMKGHVLAEAKLVGTYRRD